MLLNSGTVHVLIHAQWCAHKVMQIVLHTDVVTSASCLNPITNYRSAYWHDNMLIFAIILIL